MRQAGRIAALALALLCLLTPARAGQAPAATPLPYEAPAPFENYPEVDGQGFLREPLSKNGPAFIHADKEGGRWLYVDQSLRVEIERRMAKLRYGRVYYFIAHIRFRGELAFRGWSQSPQKPGREIAKPEQIARQHRLVYAQNGDLYTWRVYNKKYPGIIIRDGRIIHEKTYTKANVNIPPLDELSLYPDGRMAVHTPGEMTGQDYLAAGATDVFSFGPILIRDGVKEERTANYSSREPRSAIGVAGPGHFVGIMVEGRNKRSGGAGLSFVADRLLEEGCTDAFTLDGGQTAAMIFMGDIVMDPGTYNSGTKTRRQPDVVGIGVTRQRVPGK